MALSKGEIQTIAVTSAVAAAGSAVATSLITYLVDRYLIKEETEAGPQFVVVPVVQGPLPGVYEPEASASPESTQVAGLGQDREPGDLQNLAAFGSGLILGAIVVHALTR